jgi:hypothetical protein
MMHSAQRPDGMKVLAKLLYLGAVSGEKGPRSSATPELFYDSHGVYYRFETSRDELDQLNGLYRLMTTGGGHAEFALKLVDRHPRGTHHHQQPRGGGVSHHTPSFTGNELVDYLIGQHRHGNLPRDVNIVTREDGLYWSNRLLANAFLFSVPAHHDGKFGFVDDPTHTYVFNQNRPLQAPTEEAPVESKKKKGLTPLTSSLGDGFMMHDSEEKRSPLSPLTREPSSAGLGSSSSSSARAPSPELRPLPALSTSGSSSSKTPLLASSSSSSLLSPESRNSIQSQSAAAAIAAANLTIPLWSPVVGAILVLAYAVLRDGQPTLIELLCVCLVSLVLLPTLLAIHHSRLKASSSTTKHRPDISAVSPGPGSEPIVIVPKAGVNHQHQQHQHSSGIRDGVPVSEIKDLFADEDDLPSGLASPHRNSTTTNVTTQPFLVRPASNSTSSSTSSSSVETKSILSSSSSLSAATSTGYSYPIILRDLCSAEAKAGRPPRILQPNSHTAIDFENDWFKGQAWLKLYSQPMDPFYTSYWVKYPKRRFELMVQGKFKQPTQGIVYIGGEMPKPLSLGIMMRALCAAVLRIVKSINKYAHFNVPFLSLLNSPFSPTSLLIIPY